MRLIADSGSTKTDWAILNDASVVTEFQTSGINPLFRDTEDIFNELDAMLKSYRGKISAVHFYGAGVVSSEKAEVVRKALREILGNIPMEIESDILGAARALSGDCASVVCILGTGSNACLYDGEKLAYHIPPMGFILGDEASGAVLGKQLISDCFKLVMPKNVRELFINQYQLNLTKVIDNVYRMDSPNRYLSQFARFLSDFKNESYCQEVLTSQFGAFIDRNILQLPDAKDYTINFVGTVASYFQQQLKTQLEIRGLKLGIVLKSPIDGLKVYYL